MPSAVFPRNNLWLPTGTSKLSVPTGRRTITASGKVQTRTSTVAGRTWTETYPRMFAGDPDIEEFLTWTDWAWNTGQTFTVKHMMTPGSGKAPNGAGGGTPQVNAGSQSGTSIGTKLWPNNITNVVMAGDLISIAGITRVFKVTDNANSNGTGLATILINGAIYAGEEPAASAAITRSSVDITAVIMNIEIPSIVNAFWYDGLTITFREAP